MKLKDVLTDASKWTQGAYARDTNGNCVSTFSVNAVCFCLSGAILRVAPSNSDLYDRVLDLLDGVPIPTWNDAPERTFEDVRKLLEENDL